ncbi:hypothetical protein PLICRDRAFT_78604, partial [Plicaturopsis crispa FD-325 SS-3]
PELNWPPYSYRTHLCTVGNPAPARLVYIRDYDEAEREVECLPAGPLGFDLEWKPIYVKGHKENPVALVQIANAQTVLLIQVSAMERFPAKLAAVLENDDIPKAGVGIQYDTKKLFTDFGISMRNCVDLSMLARCVDNARWKGRYHNPIGLARLVSTYEELSLPKGKVQRSNWEAVLTPLQQEYAANDAHSGYAIYARLVSMLPALPRIPS